jgi:hypothetical protein
MTAVDYPALNTKVVVIPKPMEFLTGGQMDGWFTDRYYNTGKFMGIVTNEWFYVWFLKHDIPDLWLIKNDDGTLGVYNKSEVFILD